LPEPLSPTRPSRVPGSEGEVDAGQRPRRAEGDGEAADVEERAAHCSRRAPAIRGIDGRGDEVDGEVGEDVDEGREQDEGLDDGVVLLEEALGDERSRPRAS
jgi:hypothetical protein